MTDTAHFHSPADLYRLDMLRHTSFYSVNAEEKEDLLEEEEDKETILCRFCLHPVTEHGFKSSKNGRFSHYFTNPAGISFHIGIFRQAPGCSVSGPSVGEHSWFKGYAWQIALCADCQTHLGWRFVSQSENLFFGLVLRNLFIP